MASITNTLGHRDTPSLLALKGIAVGTSIFIAGSMATVSLQFLPSLVLAAQQRDSGRSTSKPESGRLTPGANAASENKHISLSPAAALKGTLDTEALSATSGYKIAAMQFALMSKTAFATQVPPELLTIVASGFLACYYRSQSLPAMIWGKWAAVAALMTAVFPLTGGFMVPLDHKLARIAGTEAAIEPFEDAPIDRAMERGNTEEFLLGWGRLNAIRTTLVVAAGGVGLWGLLA
ncbi:hypothetical protein LTR62_004721 [Meristemomyces frigidus]|uniref:DUF1772-domain-containing protein n=1 Tax=Meristemomyces frigidus TaxID=1508187 RepID=A0AAN7TE98_9PEZI|nr:hypothetical protein LTR62_004721 [Meristemomyces frigidus]